MAIWNSKVAHKWESIQIFMCGGGEAIPIAPPIDEHEILKPRASFINFQIIFFY